MNALEDKSAVLSLKTFYEPYRMETEEDELTALTGVKPLNARLAKIVDADDDEYDDTYDSVDVDTTSDRTTDEKAVAARASAATQVRQDRDQIFS